jgi:nucleoid DNA-binding protein
MEILQYIVELVQSQKEVGIAGLGTIYRKKSPGRYDAATQSFLPPSQTIDFKDEVSDTEALTILLVARENISKASAENAIKLFVGGIRQQLSEYGEANFHPLGTLKSTGDKLSIDVESNFKPGFEYFGLPKLEERPVEPEVLQPEEIAREEAEEEPIASDEPEPIPEVADVVPAVEPEVTPTPATPAVEDVMASNLMEEENPGRETAEPQLIEVPKPFEASASDYSVPNEPRVGYAPNVVVEEPAAKQDRLLLKVSLGLLALIVIGVAGYLMYPAMNDASRADGVVAVDSNKVRADSLKRMETSRAIQDSMARLDTVKTIPPAADTATIGGAGTATTLVDTTTTFEIIGASVLNRKEADWFITQMKRHGIKAKVVKNMAGKRLKMSIATVNDAEAARAERDRLEKKLKIKGIYIYRNKPE